MIKIQYVTGDGQTFENEREAKDHEECIPLIQEARVLLVGHFGDTGAVSIYNLATNLVETDLAFTLQSLLKKVLK